MDDNVFEVPMLPEIEPDFRGDGDPVDPGKLELFRKKAAQAIACANMAKIFEQQFPECPNDYADSAIELYKEAIELAFELMGDNVGTLDEPLERYMLVPSVKVQFEAF